MRWREAVKSWLELKYWQRQRAREEVLNHGHYEYFYTTHFGLTRAFYAGKRIMDIGCGPRGSLEWAESARLRVGLDPLAVRYRRLGTGRHGMCYVAAGAEQIPFADRSFDVICSFNSLDHVRDLARSTAEILRVLAPGGCFLLLTDIHQEPTWCEPTTFSWDVLSRFSPPLRVLEEQHLEKLAGGMYKCIRAGVPYDHSRKAERYGILSARLQA